VNVLLHVCCGLCLAGPLRALREEGAEVGAFFFNPNIHPLIEFRRRLKSAAVAAEALEVPFHAVDEYGLRVFLDKVDWRSAGRCADCYDLRMAGAAEAAARAGSDAFTTTLLVSAHQKHRLVKAAGRRAAEVLGVEFLCRDWRNLVEESDAWARRRSLYRQQYCGCIFSECERYRDTNVHRRKPPTETGK